MEFEVSVWTDAPFERDSLRSHLRIAMLRELGSAGVDVAFPQLDVRLWDQRKGAAVAPRHESGEKP
jgi:small-conductance mechanosensitive channel